MKLKLPVKLCCCSLARERQIRSVNGLDQCRIQITLKQQSEQAKINTRLGACYFCCVNVAQGMLGTLDGVQQEEESVEEMKEALQILQCKEGLSLQ